MPKVALYNMEGESIGEIELNETVFGAEINKIVLHQAVVAYLANQRQGTQSTKTRAEVRGGGAKPWKQKGTGRARQGSIRSPQWKGGGVAFGPKPRDYRITLNKNVKRVALRSALSSKVLDNEIMVIDTIAFDKIKTKEFNQVLSKFGDFSKALIVTMEKNVNVYMSARNIPGVMTCQVTSLNVYDILNHDKFIISKDAVLHLEEVYA